MVFRRVSLSDMELLLKYSQFDLSGACDRTPGCIMMWRDFYRTELCEQDGVLYTLLRGEDGFVYFNMPICPPELLCGAINNVVEYCRQNRIICRFCSVTEEELPILRDTLGNVNEVAQREYADYIYLTDELSNLSGKKFAAQRNHISRFTREYGAGHFEVITADSVGRALGFMDSYRLHLTKQSASALADCQMTEDVLRNLERYSMLCGMLSLGERVVGLAIGEVCKDTLIMHIEKADREILGGYQVLTNSYIHHFGGGTLYVNREDDLGDEGLRRAKLAYHPCEIKMKYTVSI